ncbi:MAG: DUF1893 domain-containing protein [Eubacterium sp.]|nr:DUF1893 domain-containing protein [Eubacterium sp.]
MAENKYNDLTIEEVIFKKEDEQKSDIGTAIDKLTYHYVVFCKDGEIFADDGKDINLILGMMKDGYDFSGYSVADKMVGKAAAMLFVKAGIKNVYGRVMSNAGFDYLMRHDVDASYGTLVEENSYDESELLSMIKQA